MGRCTSREAGPAEEEAGGQPAEAEAPSASCSRLQSTATAPEEAQARCREPAAAQAPPRSASRCTYDDPRIDNEEDQAPHQPEIGPGSHREQHYYSLIQYEQAHNPRRAEVRGRRGKRGTRKARNPRADWSRAARITRIRACPFDSNADNADPRIYAARMRADRRGSRRGLGVGYAVVPDADCALGYAKRRLKVCTIIMPWNFSADLFCREQLSTKLL